MFEQINDWARRAFSKVIPYKNIAQALKIEPTISETMAQSLELWADMYKDLSPWLDDNTGVYSLNLASTICSELARSVTMEMQTTILEPKNTIDDVDRTANTRANYLHKFFEDKVAPNIRAKVEQGMATGGMMFKPYENNGKAYVDFVPQGNYMPIAYNDDGDITEVAFSDSFVQGNKRYTKLEHHTFYEMERKAIIQNTAYKTDVNDNNGDLGQEISLSAVPQWANIAPIGEVNDIDRPLYGYYKVPKANNIDSNSPLGISVFSRATVLIERADMQFSGLDWEYTGGQLAIDVDQLSQKHGEKLNPLKQRLFRQIDMGNGDKDTYKAFTPALRDSNYIAGLNTYLTRIEDLCELSRGTLADVTDVARTATELKILKQRSYATVDTNQKALEYALKDMIQALNVYATLYNLSPQGEYEVDFDWDDSIITNVDEQFEQDLTLVENKILSKAEFRARHKGETIATAQAKIKEIQESEPQPMNDMFGNGLEQ